MRDLMKALFLTKQQNHQMIFSTILLYGVLFAVAELLVCVIIGKLKASKLPKNTESPEVDVDSSANKI
jgi:hypothetical protein